MPTRDSAGWLLSFADAYRKLGLSPLYLFDTRSSDNTLALLHSIGADVVPVEPKLDRVEAMLAVTRDVVDADWVVRFDDDEIPSTALVSWLNRSLGTIAEPSVALSRRDAQLIDGCLYYSRLEDFYFWPHEPTFLDPQLRAYRPCEVTFDDTIYKPGFLIENFRVAPQSAYFVHFNWLLRSFEERRLKVIGYERQAAGAGWRCMRFELPELHASADLRWTAFETDEFDGLARRLAESIRPDSPADCRRNPT